ncbi:hypothetical protein [Deinococcus sp. SL84]|uniref:hypothetical protein n=1 Tax=Deinococcus sp. SL84 TaxID=2994663 RepID=UPI002276FA40|nr:hypothetical protein [Deinococcus sp. SL84]MCY1702843.1 hypothetical protein [Deinococcus sp. SL84]
MPPAPARPPRRTALVWAALGLLTAALLWGVAWVELPSIGLSLSDADAHPYAAADRVSLGLGAWHTFFGADPHVGPYFTYPLLWSWATVAALVSFLALPRSAGTRPVGWAYALTAAGLLLAGVMLLPYASQEINAIFGASPQDGPRTLSGFGPYLAAEACSNWIEGTGCTAWDKMQVINPAWLGLIGVTLAPLLGLFGAAVRSRSAGPALP